MVRSLYLGILALLIVGRVAGAQITTYVAPAQPAAETRQAIAAADSARRDSVARSTVANMRAWVDSAAGVTVPATVGGLDSASVVDTTRSITTFSDGSVAPATASTLPMMLLFGVAAVIVGAGLLATRPRG